MIKKHIIGGGLAGLTAALAMAPEPVMLITACTLDDGAASLWSQGGIAAAIGPDDTVDLHAADTTAAGDGLCDPGAVTRIVGAGPRVIEQLRGFGVAFDPGLGLEAAHSRRRIAHVRDCTGLAITQQIARAVRAAAHVTILEHTSVTDLHIADKRIAGLWTLGNGIRSYFPSDAVLIATGGIGALYSHTSNPHGATGTGLALAARAGATLRDLEMMQFHPTGLDTGLAPMPLISEAVRGEGGTLIDETGQRFTEELAPRDAVSRAVFRHLGSGHRVFLDGTGISSFAKRFPTINTACKACGIDPAIEPIPVRPLAHYHMGGIATDAAGRSTVDNLFAAGEAACTGLHGANRLASNSLLEACVTGEAAGRAMAAIQPGQSGARPVEPGIRQSNSDFVKTLVSRHLGVLRSGPGLITLVTELVRHASSNDPAMIAVMMGVAALNRTESRGGHARIDFPLTQKYAAHTDLTLVQALALADALVPRRAA